jgi:hypothetical protein
MTSRPASASMERLKPVAGALMMLLPAALRGDEPGLAVHPARVVLDGPRARVQLVVSAGDTGDLFDVTREAELESSDPRVAAASPGGLIEPRGNGEAAISARWSGRSAAVPVRVTGVGAPRPVSFRLEVMPLLARHGCSSGACHGSPAGKNGFRLSLRGYDPAADRSALADELASRRIDRVRPDESLILRKAMGVVPHGGGKLLSAGSRDHDVLRGWLREGFQDDAAGGPALASIEVHPARRALRSPHDAQQIAVMARFTDGSSRDVTRLSVFTSSDERAATVSPDGLVTRSLPPARGGEAAVLVRYLDRLATARFVFLPPAGGVPAGEYPRERSYIDRHVFAKLRLLGIPASGPCTDAEFIRRAYLDTIALLPDPAEVRAFLEDPDPDRRARLVERLLERPELDDHWALKLLDVLRSSRKTLGPPAAFGLQRWVRNALATRRPLVEIARELILAEGDAVQAPATGFLRSARDPAASAEAVSQLFLGIRIGCAKCHNHPFERWTQDDYYGFAAFFAQVKLKAPDPERKDRPILYRDAGAPEVVHPRTGRPVRPRFPGEKDLDFDPARDRREALADWLADAKNPFFARSLANRTWYHVFGRGIADPPDDMRDSNPSSNDELLDALAEDLVESRYDLRALLGRILTSSAYELSHRPRPGNEDDLRYFSRTEPRLLGAEQLLDAICRVTEVPETYPGLPAGTRAVELPDGDAGGAILASFGKPSRNLTCECERETVPNPAQALEVAGGESVARRVRAPSNRLGRLLAAGRTDDAIIEELYLAAVARRPGPHELEAIRAHLAEDAGSRVSPGSEGEGNALARRRRSLEDVLWALLNSKEFLFRR